MPLGGQQSSQLATMRKPSNNSHISLEGVDWPSQRLGVWGGTGVCCSACALA
jgi:hypothetical protein